MLGDLADMQQTIGPREEFDEGTELRQPDNLAQVGLPYLGHCGQIVDHPQSLSQTDLVAGSHVHAAGIVDVNLHAGCLDDAANNLAARSDQIANLVGRNLQCVNAWSKLGSCLARTLQLRIHLVQQEEPAVPCLLHRFAHDLSRDAGDFDVHLHRGNAVARAGYLEIHIPVVIFRASDVGQDGVLIALLHQAHRNASHRTLESDTRVHQRKTCTADTRHRGRAV